MFYTAKQEDAADTTFTEQEFPPQFLTDTQVSLAVTESQVIAQHDPEEETKLEVSEEPQVVMISENLQESFAITQESPEELDASKATAPPAAPQPFPSLIEED